MKLAITSSGLGHINRGVEAWSKEAAYSLKGKPVSVTLYKGDGINGSSIERVIPCIKRKSAAARFAKKIMPSFAWRFGLGSAYQIEATSFTLNLIPELILNNYDIIHTQEAMSALILERLRKLGLFRSKIILAHGTEESFDFLKKFDYVQHLAPFHMAEARKHDVFGKKHFVVPNFVDTEKFNPSIKSSMRAELDIPSDAFIVLTVAAIKKNHKRIDYLIKEIGKISSRKDVYLIVSGSVTDDTASLENLGKEVMGNKVRFLKDLPHEKMPEVYRCGDLFVLPSLFEMFGIVFLEAMASGIVSIGHKHPVIEWVVGDGGECIDMAKDGELGRVVEKYMDNELRASISRRARGRVVEKFSKETVVNQMLKMYGDIINER